MKKLLLALALCLIAVPAYAQNTTCSNRPAADSTNACANTRFVHDHVPSTVPYGNISGLPAGTVLGNSIGATANAQALTTLPANLTIPTPTINTATINTSTIVSPTVTTRPLWTDTTSIPGLASSMWTSTYGSPGTGITNRANRWFVGPATATSGDYPPTANDWLSTLLPNTTGAAQIAALSSIGGLAVLGGARTSDFHTWTGGTSGGAQGITGFGINDDSTPSTAPIACGVCGVGIHYLAGTGITLSQFDVNNLGTTVDAFPYGGVVNGTTWAVGLTPGAYPSLGTLHNPTGALYIGDSASPGVRFRKGIISFSDALDTSVGNGGGGVFAELATGQSIRWQDATPSVKGEIFANSNGLQIQGVNTVSYTPTVGFSGGTGTSASAITGHYYQLGKLIFVQGQATIAYTTAPSFVTFSLPNSLTIAYQSAGSGFNNTIAQTLNAIGTPSATAITLFLYNGASPVTATGQVISYSGWFPVN